MLYWLQVDVHNISFKDGVFLIEHYLDYWLIGQCRDNPKTVWQYVFSNKIMTVE